MLDSFRRGFWDTKAYIVVIRPRRVAFLTTEKKIMFIGNKGVLNREDKTVGSHSPFYFYQKGRDLVAVLRFL